MNIVELPIFKQIIENSRNPVIITDHEQPDEPIIYCNKAFELLTGYSHDEIIGQNCRFLQGPDTDSEIRDEMRMAISHGEFVQTLVKNYRKNGEVFWNDLIISPIKNKYGIVTHFVGMPQDITSHKDLMDHKDAFIGMASHELKTPLTSLTLYSDIFLGQMNKGDTTAAYETAKLIHTEIKRLVTLTNSLLDISQVDRGKITIESFDINQLIEIVTAEFLLTHSTHKIIKHLLLNKKVIGDKSKITQVLLNLITNAVKYSPDSESIEISTSLENNTALIKVIDTGLGISKEEQTKIFDRFFRTTGKNKRQLPGFGLGLNICSEILKLHDSSLDVLSQEGKGSTFFFELSTDH